MGWGEIIQTLLPVVAPQAAPLMNLWNQFSNAKDTSKMETGYNQALSQQNQMSQLAAKLARERAAYESLYRTQTAQTTADKHANIFDTYNKLGPQYIASQGQVDQDYQNIKATMSSDLMTLLKQAGSKQQANLVEQLGGAGSKSFDDANTANLVKAFAPEFQKLDQNAYDAAINRSTSKSNLFNTNRTNNLGEISNLYDSKLKDERAMMGSAGTPDTGDISAALQSYLGAVTAGKKTAGENQQQASDMNAGGVGIQQFLNGTWGQATTRPDQIKWSGPAVNPSIDRIR